MTTGINAGVRTNVQDSLSPLSAQVLLVLKETLCQKCQSDPISVPSCPGSSLDWDIKAKDFCTIANHHKYHCLATQEYNEKNPNNSIIECCMEPSDITEGFRPRYNTIKGKLQEVICEENYYMPTHFGSNRWLNNGPGHCKYLKSECSGKGMVICSDGSTTEDRLCKCDFKNKYRPLLRLNPNEYCFLQLDNECDLDPDCMDPSKELNMMYECVDKCPDGFQRPDGSNDCVKTVTTESSVAVPTAQPTMKTATPPQPVLPTTTEPMVKPEQESNFKTIVIVVIVSVLVSFGLSVIFVVCYRKEPLVAHCCNRNYHKYVAENQAIGNNPTVIGKIEKNKHVSSPTTYTKIDMPEEDNPEITLTVPADGVMLGCGINLHLTIKNKPEDGRVTWHRIKSQFESISDDNSITISNTTKEKYDAHVHGNRATLIIKNTQKSDEGYYICVLNSKDLDTPLESNREFLHVNADTCTSTGREEKVEVETLRKSEKVEATTSKPKVKLSQPDNGKVGGDRTIHCEILNCDKKEFSIWWKRHLHESQKEEYVKIDRKKFTGSLNYFPSLTIHNVALDDKGRYWCILKYDETEVESNHVFFSVDEDTATVNNKVKMIVEGGGKVILGEHTTVTESQSRSKSSSSSGSEGDESDNSEDGIESSPEKRETERRRDQQEPNNSGAEGQSGGGNSSTSSNGEYQKLEEMAACRNLFIENVKGDGNCQFRALAKSLSRRLNTEIDHHELRLIAVQYLENNDTTPHGDKYSSYMTQNQNQNCDISWNDHLQRMKQIGEYGDETTLHAICHRFGVEIKVLSTIGKDFVVYKPKDNSSGIEPIFLGFLHDSKHYVILNSQK